MQLKQLGNSGLHVSPLMFGGNVFGWTVTPEDSFRLLDAFTAAGFNFIDTADVYSIWVPGHQGGESESIIGQWLQRTGKRDQVVLATKVGFDMRDGNKGLLRQWILRAVEDSLRRLQTDHIDLYQSHTDDGSVPLDETLEAYQELIQSGKVRVIGASNYSGARLREAVELARREGLPVYQTLQPEYNLYDRQKFEQDQQPVARELNLGVIPYFSLASGFLTGKYKSRADSAGANREARVARYFDERGLRILAALESVAAETQAHPAIIALAWLAAQPTILAPIASATSEDQLKSLLALPDLHLTQAQLDHLTQASAY